jgi:hypothetical protein
LLFPDEMGNVKHHFTSNGGVAWDVVTNNLVLDGCLEFEPGHSPKPLINHDCRQVVQDWVEKQLCREDEALDALRSLITGMFANNFERDFRTWLRNFFVGDFFRGLYIQQAADPSVYVIKHTPDESPWVLFLSIPNIEDGGRLEHLDHFLNLVEIEDTTYRPDPGQRIIKILAAPAIADTITRRAIRASYGVHLMDWMTVLLLRKYMATSDAPSHDALKNLSSMFNQPAGVWNFEVGIRNIRPQGENQ